MTTDTTVAETQAAETGYPQEGQYVPAGEETTPEDSTPKLEVFRDVPNFDSRTLVLKYGEKLLDLQFCGCVNKYKRRFSQFLDENSGLYEDVKGNAVELAANGYKDVDVKDILEALRHQAKLATPASDYLKTYTHDFTLDSLPRAYLIRKLMMDDERLFGFFHLTPTKCRSNCGYGSTKVEEPEPTADTDIAGF